MTTKEKAEQMFEEKFKSKRRFGNFNVFKRMNLAVYNDVIIPSLIDALNAEKPVETESKPLLTIKENQILTEGDHFIGGTEEQYKELLKIEEVHKKNEVTSYYSGLCAQKGIFFNGSTLLSMHICTSIGKHYEFEDYKQLCINTFPTDNGK